MITMVNPRLSVFTSRVFLELYFGIMYLERYWAHREVMTKLMIDMYEITPALRRKKSNEGICLFHIGKLLLKGYFLKKFGASNSSVSLKKSISMFQPMAPFCRPFVAVAPTTLVDDAQRRLPMRGLFTTRPLKAGQFLGFYNGTFREGDYKGRDTYVMSTSDFHIRPKKTRGVVDPAAYPLAMCNEPPNGSMANVVIHEFTRARGVLPHLPPTASIAAIGFFACRDVRAGEELFVHYGNRFARPLPGRSAGSKEEYSVGVPCRIKKSECETPVQMMEALGLLPHVDRECYVEYE